MGSQIFTAMIFYRYIDWTRVLELLSKLLKGDFIKNQVIRFMWLVTLRAIIAILFIYVVNLFMDWWQGIVDYINYVRWYSK